MTRTAAGYMAEALTQAGATLRLASLSEASPTAGNCYGLGAFVSGVSGRKRDHARPGNSNA
jgi:hypothetical protein